MTPQPTDPVALVLLNARGLDIARKIKAAWPATDILGLEGRVTDADSTFDDTGETLRALYSAGTSIIGLCATGIMIRALAPALSDKRAEPPVLSMSDDGAVIVPLLGGLGGANELAAALAVITGGTATITASGARQFGLQLETPPQGYTLANPENAKSVTSDILAGTSVRLEGHADFLANSNLPFAPDGNISIRVTVQSIAGATDGLVYHPRTVVVIPDNPDRISQTSINTVCAELNIAHEAIAAILLPDGADPDSEAVLSGIPIRYGAPPADFKSLGSLNGLHFIEVPSPDAVEITGRAHGTLAVVGLGPGNQEYLTPDARKCLARAQDLVGYDTYLDLVPDIRLSQTRHASGNRVEMKRAEQALDLAVRGRRVALVTSGDPGIFAMASAVMEALDARPGRWTGLDVTVIPGISAMQTAAARIGAPLGHDFCTISLSDIRKPWDVVATRLRAAAKADFVIALYNPASKSRRDQICQTKKLLLEVREPGTPVIIGRDLGRAGETVTITTLGAFDPDTIDMRTILIIGSSRTLAFDGPGGRKMVYTPRTYDLVHNAESDGSQ